jgi:hypothetical protein
MKRNFASPIEYDPFTSNAKTLWEPVWQLRIPLTSCERELFNTWALHRLGFVRTFGAGGLVMPTQHSRLAHVRGVFALAAHFRPADEPLRLAALLHDVGHGPFSHSAEALPGFDHHVAGQALILGEEVGGILRKYGFDPEQIVALTEGNPPNPVRTQNGLLHLDHLDFFVRDPFACGWHAPLPADILSRLHLDGANVATDLAMAEHLIERITFENELFVAPVKIAAEAVLEHLLKQAGEKGILNTDPHQFVRLTDADLLAQLAQVGDAEITALLDRLWRYSHTLTVRRVLEDEAVPLHALVVRFEQLYLNQPLVDGQPVEQVSSVAAKMLAEARNLRGVFVVEISG